MQGQEWHRLDWAVLTVWGIVNAVNLLQGVGFLSRVWTGARNINRVLGLVMIVLALPAAAALYSFLREGAGWLLWSGPALYVLFIAFELAVDYLWVIEFRDPVRAAILVPYLLLFFGSILLMGLPMFRANRSLWMVTAATTVFLLVSMGVAMRKGVA